jgi:hypothetical protein
LRDNPLPGAELLQDPSNLNYYILKSSRGTRFQAAVLRRRWMSAFLEAKIAAVSRCP